MLRKIFLPFLILILFLSWITPVQAGFGVSPPSVRNRQLTPGTIFKKEIRLLRSSAEEDLKAEIKINAPEIDSWISIDKGEEFILPKGELQVPMIVTFDIPSDAELGNYSGHINVRILPVDGKRSSGVAIALGARIDIDLALTNVSFTNFLVRVISIPDFEKLGSPWNWKIWRALFNKLFYKIKVVMNIENTGNVKTAPSKVAVEVYDITKKKLLELSEDKSLKKVEPFSTSQVVASFPTKLDVGQYWAKVKIYKGSQIVNFYEIAFTIEKYKGEKSLGVWPWLVLLLLVLIALLIIILLIKIRIWRYLVVLFVVIFKPILKAIFGFLKNINRKFWKWAGKRAEKYKD